MKKQGNINIFIPLLQQKINPTEVFLYVTDILKKLI